MTALARFIAAHPLVKVSLQVRAWDELLQRLRGHELDFFVAESRPLQRDADLEIEPLVEHPLHFVARSGHPLAGRSDATARDAVAYPIAALSRVPPRILEPLLASQRQSPDPTAAFRPVPAIENAALAAVKQLVAGSDVITVVPLACIRGEIESGTLEVVGAEPSLRLNCGLVKLKGQALGPPAARLRQLVLEAEAQLTLDESTLLARLASRGGEGDGRRRRKPMRAEGR